jgi:hypothetical protein
MNVLFSSWYQSVIGISFCLSQSDPIKRHLMYSKTFPSRLSKLAFKITAWIGQTAEIFWQWRGKLERLPTDRIIPFATPTRSFSTTRTEISFSDRRYPATRFDFNSNNLNKLSVLNFKRQLYINPRTKFYRRNLKTKPALNFLFLKTLV